MGLYVSDDVTAGLIAWYKLDEGRPARAEGHI